LIDDQWDHRDRHRPRLLMLAFMFFFISIFGENLPN
jgi:hypothetical protein